MNHDKSIVNHSPSAMVQIQQKHETVSRADIAATIRAKQDVQKQINNLRSELTNVMVNDSSISGDKILSVIESKNKLVELERKGDEFFSELSSLQPKINSKVRFSEQEIEEIKNVAALKRYTQEQLGEQWGVSQPAISEILKK